MKFGFTTIATDNFEQTCDFYKKILEFTVTKEFSPNPGVQIAFMEKNGNNIEIISRGGTQNYNNSASSVILTFLVDDIDDAYADMKKKGVKITDEIARMPNGLQIFHAADPNGIALGFVKQ